MVVKFKKKQIVLQINYFNTNCVKYIFLFSELLYRTDFFPGLGWMLEKTVWDEIKSNWPAT